MQPDAPLAAPTAEDAAPAALAARVELAEDAGGAAAAEDAGAAASHHPGLRSFFLSSYTQIFLPTGEFRQRTFEWRLQSQYNRNQNSFIRKQKWKRQRRSNLAFFSHAEIETLFIHRKVLSVRSFAL